MFVAATQVRSAFDLVAVKLEFQQLWNGDLQSFPNSAQACIARSLWGASNLFQKIGSEGISQFSKVAVRLSHQLRDEVEIPKRLEKIGEFPKFTIYICLLDMRLVETLRIILIIGGRTAKNQFVGSSNDLTFYDWPLPVVLTKTNLIVPSRAIVVGSYRYSNLNIRITPSR